MSLFTCPNPVCENFGVPIPVDWARIRADNAAADPPITTGPVICGVCRADITDTEEPDTSPVRPADADLEDTLEMDPFVDDEPVGGAP